MTTKRLSFKADSITSNRIDTVSKRRNIPADEATNTNTHFSYASPTGSLLVNEDVIDYETQLALREKWKNLTITDNFLFEKVMRNKRICKRLIEKILGMTIAEISFPESEKVIDMRRDSKGVRLDVYVTKKSPVYRHHKSGLTNDIVQPIYRTLFSPG